MTNRLWKISVLVFFATVLTVVFGVLTKVPAAYATNPQTISFQGKVVNANGTNVADGTYSFVFKLYTISSGGAAIWTETDSLSVTAGVFQVNLGVNTVLTTIDFNANPALYLGITFNSDPAGEMSPRVQLQSVPYAFNSDKVGGLTAAQLVQLSPGSAQSGFVNVNQASTFSGGLSASGGAVNLNDNSNNNTKVNTGTSTGTVTIGNGAAGAISIQNGSTAALTLQSGNAINLTAAAASSFSFGSNSLGITSSNLTVNSSTGVVTLGGSAPSLTATSGTNLSITTQGSGVLSLGTGTGGVLSLASSVTTLQRSAATGLTLDLNDSGTTTLVLQNSGAGVANLNLSDGSLQTAGTTRLDNAGNLKSIGTIAAATNGATSQFNVDSTGDVTGTATAVGVTSTANGSSGFGTSTSLTLTSAASFTAGDYVQMNSSNCGGTGINPCYAKITAKATNTLTITPALTWANGSTVNEYIFPEIGGNEVVSPALTVRYGRGWFISGVATGNGTTYYDEDGISTSLPVYNIDTDNANSNVLNIGGNTTTSVTIGGTGTTGITLGTSGTITSVAGSLQTSNNGNINAGTGALQGGSLSINSGAFAVNSAGAITASTGIASSGGYVQSGSTANTFSGASTFSAAGTALTVTNTASIGTLSVGAGGLSVTGSSGLAVTTVTGTASINTSGTAATTIGNTSAATAVNIKGGSTGAINLTGPVNVTEVSGQAIAVNDGGRVTFVQSAAGQGLFGNNTVYNGTNNVYQATGASSLVDLAAGNIFLTVAPSGTAGATETFTAGLTVLNNGSVGVATATPSGLFSVGASSQFQVNASGAITALTGVATSGGYVQSGTTANTLTGATTFSAAGTALSVTNTASIGTLSVTSAGTFGTGLTVTTGGLTVSAGGATITGNSSVTGNINGTGRVTLPMASGTNGQGFFVQNGSSVPITSFQGLDTGTNSFGFFGVNKYFNGTTWVDDGQARVGSSFQIQDNTFNFYQFDTAANFHSRLVLNASGNVGIGQDVSPGFLLDVQGGDINTSANLRTGGTTRIDASGNHVNAGNYTGAGAVTIDSAAASALGLGTSASAKTITIGNVTGATGLVFNSGTAGDTFNLVAAGQLAVTSGSNVPTVDQLAITNTGSTGVTTAGINGLSVAFKGGAAAIEAAAERIDIQPGTTSGGTWSGLRVVPNATGAVSGVTENGVNVEDLTTPGAGTENALTVGVGWDNVLQSTHTTITQAGLITGVTINATTGYQAGGTAGITVAACTAGQYIGNAVAVKDGLITAGSCRTDATGLSDIRVKTNIVSLDSNVLDTIKQVNTVNFDFDCSNPYFTESSTDCDTRLQTGVIAQQLQQIFPQLVYTDDWGFYHVDYQGLSVETLKAVTQLAQFINSAGEANLTSVTAGSVTSGSVTSPSLVSNGALSIEAGSGGDVAIDTTTPTNAVDIGTLAAGGVNLSRQGQQTTVNGGLVVDEASNFTAGLSAGSVTVNGSLTAKGAFNLVNAANQSVVSFSQDGSASFSGDLNLHSAMLSGGLTVGGDVTVSGLSTFQKLATFLAKTVFRQDVEFDGHITVASDTAGYATLRQGESTVHVAFTTPYDNPPVVTADITNGQFAATSVNNVTATGFDIQLALPAITETTLSWTAIGVINPQTASNPPPTNP